MDSTKKTLIVKGICVLLSFILWLYVSNVENPIRTSDIKKVSVELLNQDILGQNNLYISGDRNFTVDLKLEGKAQDIYSLSKGDFVLKADLSSYALKKGENVIPVEVVRSPSDVTIKNKTMLAVTVNLEEKTEKTVNVYSKVTTNFKDGVTKQSINVTPDHVKVSGPESLVNSVSSVVMKGELLDISKNTNHSFKLIAVDSDGNEVEGVELSESTGKLVINVSGAKQVKINPVYDGKLPEDLTLEGVTLSTDTVNLTGKSSVLKSISQINTEPINLSNVTESGSIEVKLNIPDGVQILEGINKVTASIKVSKKDVSSDGNKVVTKKISGIKVNLTNKEKANLNYETSDITVQVSGKSSEVEKITADNITASASAAGITEAGETNVPLSVSISNGGASISIVDKPETIKIIVK